MIESTTPQRQREYWEAEHGFRRYDHPVVETFARQRVEMIADWFKDGPIDSALDVGCGDGFSTYYMRECAKSIAAMDLSNRMLGNHPLAGDGRLLRGNVMNAPFGDDAFDLVYGWEVLHHIENPLDAVKEMARVSRRWVLIAEPNRAHPAQLAFALIDREHRWVLRYSQRFMANLLKDAGLEVVRTAIGGWLFPNKTPGFLAPLLAKLPYQTRLGVTHWALGRKIG